MGDWWYAAAELPLSAQGQIARWVLEQEWAPNTVFKKPTDYHVTLAYAYDGRGRQDLPQRIASVRPVVSYMCKAHRPDAFTDALGRGLTPVVLKLDAPELAQHVAYHVNEFKRAGYKVSEFLEDGYQPHVTVAMVDPVWAPEERIKRMSAPNLAFYLGNTIVTGGVRL
jgi:2'-5' RNA ligase